MLDSDGGTASVKSHPISASLRGVERLLSVSGIRRIDMQVSQMTDT